MKKGFSTAFFLAALLAAPLAWAEGLSVKEPWVREAPPGMQMTAGYMLLENTGQAPQIVTAVEAGGFGKAEIHNVIQEAGMAKMVPQPFLEIPAKGSIALQPGGYHLMLLEMKQPIQAGQKVSLTLILKDGTRVAVDAEVKKDAGGMAGHHHGGHGM